MKLRQNLNYRNDKIFLVKFTRKMKLNFAESFHLFKFDQMIKIDPNFCQTVKKAWIKVGNEFNAPRFSPNPQI